jgi:hypothetical protein
MKKCYKIGALNKFMNKCHKIGALVHVHWIPMDFYGTAMDKTHFLIPNAKVFWEYSN